MFVILFRNVQLTNKRYTCNGIVEIDQTDHYQYCADQNDEISFYCLYREGKSSTRIMNVGLEYRFSGHPGRARAVAGFLDYATSHTDVCVWICRREDIARHLIATKACSIEKQ